MYHQHAEGIRMSRITRVTSVVRRVVDAGRLGEVVVEIGTGSLTVRPLRSRRPLLEATYQEVVTATLMGRAPRRKRGDR